MIEVKAYPSSSKPSIHFDGERYHVHVKEPADDGKANVAIQKALSKYLKKQLILKRGNTSKIKYFEER